MGEKWHLFCSIGDGMNVMVCHSIKGAAYAPLYIAHFRLSRLLAAVKHQLRCTDPAQLPTVGDKLRWYRCQKGLRQWDVADFVGINRSTYLDFEDPKRDCYPLEKLERIAELLEVPIVNLLDGYNRFLYVGQGRQVQALRRHMGLTRREFGKWCGVGAEAVKRWENDTARIT